MPSTLLACEIWRRLLAAPALAGVVGASVAPAGGRDRVVVTITQHIMVKATRQTLDWKAAS